MWAKAISTFFRCLAECSNALVLAGADLIAQLFVDIPGDLAKRSGCAPGAQSAARTIFLASFVIEDAALADGAGGGQFLAAGADIMVRLGIEDKVRA